MLSLRACNFVSVSIPQSHSETHEFRSPRERVEKEESGHESLDRDQSAYVQFLQSAFSPLAEPLNWGMGAVFVICL